MKLDPQSTALVLIDLQKGILSRDTAPRSTAEVVATSKTLADKFRAAGAPVVLVHVTWSEDYGDALSQPTDQPNPRMPADKLAEFAEFADGLRQPTDIIIKKRQWGAFYGTELDLQLRRRGVKTIVLGGVATNMGVESTARDAYERGYAIVLAEDICASMKAEWHDFAIQNILPRISRIMASTDVELS